MGTDDNIKNKAQELKGQAEKAAGEATDDESLERKGQRDQAKSKLRQAGEKTKDAAKDAFGR